MAESRGKIMLIDDEKDFTDMIQERLLSEGYDVIALNSSEHALEQVKQEKPDLILLDIVMPYKDGYLVKDEIKSDHEIRNIPIIFFTAKQTEEEIIRDAKTSFKVEDVMPKPVPSEFLVEKVRSVLEKYSD